MDAETFNRWLSDMKAAGHAKTDKDCGALMGITKETVRAWKAGGVPASTSRRVSLACAVLLIGGKPYGDEA